MYYKLEIYYCYLLFCVVYFDNNLYNLCKKLLCKDRLKVVL